MRTRDAKKLKIGDRIKVVRKHKTHGYYGMGADIIGQSGPIVGIKSPSTDAEVKLGIRFDVKFDDAVCREPLIVHASMCERAE